MQSRFRCGFVSANVGDTFPRFAIGQLATLFSLYFDDERIRRIQWRKSHYYAISPIFAEEMPCGRFKIGEFDPLERKAKFYNNSEEYVVMDCFFFLFVYAH